MKTIDWNERRQGEEAKQFIKENGILVSAL